MKKSIKIGILVSGLPPIAIGGTEIATHNIAKFLSRKHFEVHVITRNPRIKIKGKKRSLKKVEKYKGYIIHRIPCSSSPLLRFITHVLFGLKALIKIKPDLIHGQQITPNGLIAVLAGKLLRKKTLVWAQGSEIYNSSLLYLKSIGQFVISKATVVLGVSTHMKNRMKYIWPQQPIYHLSNGIELGTYFHEPAPKSTVEIIFVGRLIKIKRISNAIKAISYLKDDIPKVMLTIIGSGPTEELLKKQCGLLKIEDHIRFLGNIPHEEIPKILSRADIFIFPSLREGLPIAILEAMASGLPILASRTTALPELVHDQINGLLHSPGNVSELTRNLKILIQNEALRNSMGKKSREFAHKYSWKKIINRLIKFYLHM
ncbi:MAG: glycosyltransferase [Candidatus Helarchaeota archaeon]|nr:glycosyltransferase [Candidatus Helarchaeota archaeon]